MIIFQRRLTTNDFIKTRKPLVPRVPLTHLDLQSGILSKQKEEAWTSGLKNVNPVPPSDAVWKQKKIF